MNFIEEFKKGQSGSNKGIPIGFGLSNVSNAINGVQRGRLYGIAAAPKAGKSTFVDYAFLIQPFLFSVANNVNIEWLYYSLEIDRVSKEFDISVFFLNLDYGIEHIQLDEGITKDGKKVIPLNSDYLRGRIIDDNGDTILVKETIIEKLKIVYKERIIPLFGEYSDKGTLLKPGKVVFIEQKNNPTGIKKEIKRHAEKNGKFLEDRSGPKPRIVGYIPNDPDKFTIVITDHLRKMLPERNWPIKQTVDKMIEYQVELKNWTGYTFVDIIHTNRDIVNQERLRFAKDMLYPTSDDIKDTGNLAEDADYVFTMMNPNDDRYNLNRHFGNTIKDDSGNPLYPNLRTIHLVESRHCKYPQHFKTNMRGNLKTFEQIKF